MTFYQSSIFEFIFWPSQCGKQPFRENLVQIVAFVRLEFGYWQTDRHMDRHTHKDKLRWKCNFSIISWRCKQYIFRQIIGRSCIFLLRNEKLLTCYTTTKSWKGYIFIAVCLSPCLSISLLASEQISSQTDAIILMRFSLNGCFQHRLKLRNMNKIIIFRISQPRIPTNDLSAFSTISEPHTYT